MPQAAARHGSLDARRALLGLQRAYRVDQPATLAEHGGGSPQQPVLRLRQRAHVARPLEVRHVGVAADRSGGAARRVQQHGVERLGGRPLGGVGLHQFGLQMPMPQVLLQPRQPRRVTLDCDDGCASRGKLRRLPAGRGTEIGYVFAGRAASNLAGRAAAASCTQNSPRSKPATSVTWVPTGKRTEPVGNRMPPGGSVAGFGVTSSGASR